MSDDRWREKYYDKCDELSRFEIENAALRELLNDAKNTIVLWLKTQDFLDKKPNVLRVKEAMDGTDLFLVKAEKLLGESK
jgi:hypothetical protein